MLDESYLRDSIEEVKKTLKSIHSVLSWIAFFIIAPIILGLIIGFGSCISGMR